MHIKSKTRGKPVDKLAWRFIIVSNFARANLLDRIDKRVYRVKLFNFFRKFSRFFERIVKNYHSYSVRAG